MSLQSRLDIICDEAYANVGPEDSVVPESSDGISTDKPVSQHVLHFLRFVDYIFICLCYVYEGRLGGKSMFIVSMLCLLVLVRRVVFDMYAFMNHVPNLYFLGHL